MASEKWPEAGKRSLIGKRVTRLDGAVKSTGRAKYTYDVNRKGMLHGKLVFSPHAHAKIVSIDTSAAEKMPGVKAVQLMIEPGKEVLWQGQEILALAAETEEQARDAARAVKIRFEKLPHFVADAPPEKAGQHQTALAEQVTGNPDQGFKEAEVTSEGTYGCPVITHCCLEAHGQVAEWEGDTLRVWASTQNVSGISGELVDGLKAGGVEVPASNVQILTPVMGGGFGSKFGADTWGVACAQLAKKAGRPVKMMLERDHELMAAGARPSIYARVRVGAKKDGTLTAWSSESWGTGGIGPAGNPNLPYVFTRIPNRRSRHTRVETNTGPARAWRAPNHPQMCLITMSALEDLAAQLPMDPLDFFLKNLPFVIPERAETYRQELVKGAELMEWKKKWHSRGDKTPGPIKRGLGLSIHTWGGGGHSSNCNCTIRPDGSVEVFLGSQDLGTGTRTVIAMVAAETLGLPVSAVKVNIGDSKFPPSGASGGSTTVGGVSASTRRATTRALNELLAKVAPALGVTPDKLEAACGTIRVAGDPTKAIAWHQACAKLGTAAITASGQRAPRGPDELISSGVGGIQMAEVAVDVETGVVKIEKLVAVQDCGLVINPKTAESQIYGAMIMGVGYALYEEKLMDETTGRCLNPDMEFYKLAGIGDVGNMVVHFMTGPGYDERGVIGLGEPPVISPGAAISNAVANAIGARVPTIPLTPDKVLAALEKVPRSALNDSSLRSEQEGGAA
ncbi:MAG: xanthine dehydrogenase family protein molybdopterin-binding subunit [Acidobacteria bacterium]|nr:xanthine dehydrogenase family protein molybdopterin-binding subunit [Acidobacteriota bacterium]MBI3663060.1 xanthine dehydrogenase family protein molybdopterin-binding subunit [Acidobacteriota bacterium]